MSHEVFYGADARRRILAGAEIIYKPVAVTYGIKGRYVAISKPHAAPEITRDGVKVANSIDVPITIETLGYRDGAENLKEASRQLNAESGDATSTVVIFGYKLQEEMDRLINTGGIDPVQLYEQVADGADDVITLLGNMSQEITADSEELLDVATISAGSKKLGEMVASVFKQIGKNGIVKVETHTGYKTTVDIASGFEIDKGLMSELIINDPAKQQGVYKDINVVISTDKVETWEQVADTLNAALNERKEVVIIADDFDNEVLRGFYTNKRDNNITVIAIKAPSFNERKMHALQDIATFVGAPLISEGVSEKGHGTVDELRIGIDRTTFIGGKGKAKEVKQRVKDLIEQAENATDKFIKDYLINRAAALDGKLAMIKVGGASSGEIGKNKDHIDDAVASAKRALESGVLPGGGVTLVNISQKLKGGNPGRDAIIKVLREPFLQLMKNAGLNGEKMIAMVEDAEDGMGIDLRSTDHELVNMKEAHVIDATSIVQQAVRVAVSSAGNIATIEALVVDQPSDEVIPQ